MYKSLFSYFLPSVWFITLRWNLRNVNSITEIQMPESNRDAPHVVNFPPQARSARSAGFSLAFRVRASKVPADGKAPRERQANHSTCKEPITPGVHSSWKLVYTTLRSNRSSKPDLPSRPHQPSPIVSHERMKWKNRLRRLGLTPQDFP